MNVFFDEIEKFKLWDISRFDMDQDQIGSEWECDYPEWQNIYNAYDQFISQTLPHEWTQDQKENLLYILARDNENEYIADGLSKNMIDILALEATKNSQIPKDAKWQLVIQLHKLKDKPIAWKYLDIFIQDTNEYVVRRSLMEMGRLKHPKTENNSEVLWNKNIYAEMEEYQRIAVLHALYAYGSKKIYYYLEQAEIDGRTYLLLNAKKIQQALNSI